MHFLILFIFCLPVHGTLLCAKLGREAILEVQNFAQAYVFGSLFALGLWEIIYIFGKRRITVSGARLKTR